MFAKCFYEVLKIPNNDRNWWRTNSISYKIKIRIAQEWWINRQNTSHNLYHKDRSLNSQRISFLSVAWLVLRVATRASSIHGRLKRRLAAALFGMFISSLPRLSARAYRCSRAPSLFLEGHFGIHLEVASDSFCFLINSSWLLVFILYVFSLFFLGFNLYCLKGIHFS